jgi:hypothetical protein
MSSTDRAVRSALVVAAGALGIVGASSSAAAQRRNPVVAQAAAPPPEPRTMPYVPYPGATVIIDPRLSGFQQMHPQLRHPQRQQAPVVYYIPVPVPMGNGYGGGGGYGGGVTDVNGRPLYIGTEAPASASSQYEGPLGTPDLTGAPYVVGEGGAMVVDFGNGDRRTVAACAALAAERTPEGQTRTIFYQPPADALILRAGQRGRVHGAPAAGAAVCYTADVYGRVVLDY